MKNYFERKNHFFLDAREQNTYTHTYINIYVERERERERDCVLRVGILSGGKAKIRTGDLYGN